MGANFKELIKTDPNKAAGILQDSFLHIINTMIPQIYLTKEEYHKLIKIILAGEAECDHDYSETEEGAGDAETSEPDTETE